MTEAGLHSSRAMFPYTLWTRTSSSSRSTPLPSASSNGSRADWSHDSWVRLCPRLGTCCHSTAWSNGNRCRRDLCVWTLFAPVLEPWHLMWIQRFPWGLLLGEGSWKVCWLVACCLRMVLRLKRCLLGTVAAAYCTDCWTDFARTGSRSHGCC